MSQHYSDPSRESDPHALPDVEVFYVELPETTGHTKYETPFDSVGWYYWYCFPGCLPDGEANGPYDSEQEAIDAMREDTDNGN